MEYQFPSRSARVIPPTSPKPPVAVKSAATVSIALSACDPADCGSCIVVETQHLRGRFPSWCFRTPLRRDQRARVCGGCAR